MSKISNDAVEGLYFGLSIGVGIVGFIIVSVITHWLMPSWGATSDFGGFIWVCGWASIWIIYLTIYIFAALCGLPCVKRIVLGGNQ